QEKACLGGSPNRMSSGPPETELPPRMAEAVLHTGLLWARLELVVQANLADVQRALVQDRCRKAARDRRCRQPDVVVLAEDRNVLRDAIGGAHAKHRARVCLFEVAEGIPLEPEVGDGEASLGIDHGLV